MNIKVQLFGLLGLAFTVVVLHFLIERTIFLISAQRTTANVASIEWEFQDCGGRHRYPCTVFTATVHFMVRGFAYSARLPAGSTRGHYDSDERADYRVGQKLPVVFNPRRPHRAFEDSFWGVWSTPLVAVFAQISAFLAALRHRS